VGTRFCSQKWLVMIPVGTSGVSYCCLAFARPLISQFGRNDAENARWMLKGIVVAGHRTGEGYRQGLAGSLLLPQKPHSAHALGTAEVVFGSSQGNQSGSGLCAVHSKIPRTSRFLSILETYSFLTGLTGFTPTPLPSLSHLWIQQLGALFPNSLRGSIRSSFLIIS